MVDMTNPTDVTVPVEIGLLGRLVAADEHAYSNRATHAERAAVRALIAEARR